MYIHIIYGIPAVHRSLQSNFTANLNLIMAGTQSSKKRRKGRASSPSSASSSQLSPLKRKKINQLSIL